MNKISSKFQFYLILLIGNIIVSCSHIKKKEFPHYNQENIFQKPEYDSLGIIKGIFDIPELVISPSPVSRQSIQINENEAVIDFDVSPVDPVVAMLVRNSKQENSIKFWQIAQNNISDSLTISGFSTASIAWHPRANALFVIGLKNELYHILRIEKRNKNWIVKSIFSSSNKLRRLVVCPRPFIVGSDYQKKEDYYTYRIFFGMSGDNNSNRIVSITETGNRFYQVIGPKKTFTLFEDEGPPPSQLESNWALPIAFHPAGHQLIWEDKKNNFFTAKYESKYWADRSKPFSKEVPRTGTITPTPNGLGLLHWQKNKKGIGLYLFTENKEEFQIPEYNFITTASLVADGKGIVGLTKIDEHYFLNYVPINVPLADVVNAWMFSETSEELNLFKRNYGLFRTTNDEQLYQLYETENYYCNSYDRTTPTRPYLVTTDIFWELFASAYEGLFIVKERDEAMPDFWNFVNAANQYYKKTDGKSQWCPVFMALADLNAENSINSEVIKIKSASGIIFSEILKRNYNYSELKPRGHYTSSREMEKYFMAFKYLTTAFSNKPNIMEELNSLPIEVKNYAVNWIKSYMGFISSPRSPLIWSEIKFSNSSYTQFPIKDPKIFPLSWGFDNEVLNSTVYHIDFPQDLQIIGPGGPRLVPSGLDLVSALGNSYADSLLGQDFKRYPPLKRAINKLKDNFRSNGKVSNNNENLYDRWLTALAVQWADTLNSPAGTLDKNIWQVKRIQTGLSSWATLRHATVLVNERSAAECGEGGFEEILLRAPRGYVEPDPYTFGAIAELFETAIKYVSESTSRNEDIHESSLEAKTTLYDGIVRRLKETAQNARIFQSIAEKEIKGEPISNDDYEMILYTGGVAEHYLLIFKSLANKEYALSTPEPIGKITDVAGGGNYDVPYLMAAVGNPLEWNNVVPFYGRNQIVKGAVYSYYEFQSDVLLNDKEWQQKIQTQELQSWLKPFITEKMVSYPAVTGY